MIPALIEKLSALQGPSREVDAEIVVHFDIRPRWLEGEEGELWLRDSNGLGPEVAFTNGLRRGRGNPRVWGTAEVYRHMGDGYLPAYTASLDAAIALTERVLPGYRRMIAHNWAFIQGTDPASRKFVTELHPIEIDGEYNADDTFDTRAFGPTEPIALVLATLRALEAKETSR